MILTGNSLDVLKTFDDNSVDSVCTDPPYGIAFMNKKWDYNVPSSELWLEVLRVLKPGGHALIACGTRTYHRMAVNVEDAGFEVRDIVSWIYGSGFPKSLDVSKATLKYIQERNSRAGQVEIPHEVSKQWNGFGTALKPAHELWCLARKPLSESTVAKNVLTHGAGALNIDGCRVEGLSDKELNWTPQRQKQKDDGLYGNGKGFFPKEEQPMFNSKGRWPANVILDEEAGALLDEQSGITTSGVSKRKHESYAGDSITGFLRGVSSMQNQHGGTGGASRFFFRVPSLNLYSAKDMYSAWKIKHVNTANESLNLSNLHVDSVLKHALTEVLPEARVLSVSTIPSMTVKESELENVCESVIELMTCLEKNAWHELLQGKLTQSKCLVQIVETNALTDTTTITISHWRLDGCADVAILLTIATNLAPGEKDLASRFRYCAKASKSERNAGLADLPFIKPTEITGRKEGSAGQNHPRAGIQTGDRQNSHPTVKPVKLMEYLCKLITPPGGIVLDPFAGSGSTGVAAKNLGFQFIGIELNPEYAEIARKRIG